MIPQTLLEKLRQAQRVVVMTGAGVSAESGVPTFRDAQTGLWAKYDPTELASPEAFRRDPKLVWDWYKWRQQLAADVQPNAGHYALVELAALVPHFTLITQNVDGLHHTAGNQNILELHGNIQRTKCFAHGHIYEGWPDDTAVSPPLCTTCGSPMRPDVVWFGESLPLPTLEAAAQAAVLADVYFTIGTSALVHPAASLTVSALQAGATVVEINPNET
ncbi:MAG: NAD-dependent deacylase, partial [Anaerolineales bacterium]|nr:NAD-dependent deacylase [Anaerolineales bacterium]